MKRNLRRLCAVSAATVAFGAGAAVCLPSAHAATDAAILRVNQVGYIAGESKTAFAMGPDAALASAGFQVVDPNGTTVLTGNVGPKTGAWNTTFESVHSIDLSGLTQPGTYTLQLTGAASSVSPHFRVGAASEILGPLLADNVKFFQAQRDGDQVLPGVMGRRQSHLADQQATVYNTPDYNADGTQLMSPLQPAGGPVDVSGGWFDAGDFLKFTGTTAYSADMLLLAERAQPSTAGLADEADFGLSWLDRMWNGATGTLYAQVGIGAGTDTILTDHDVWRLPEADDAMQVSPGDQNYLIKYRPVFRANQPGQPITPSLAGRVAAAFALAAQTRANTDPVSANQWLTKAAAVYAQADTQPSSNVTAFPKQFYPETSWQDDLEFGATELAVAGRALADNRTDGWQADAYRWANAYMSSTTTGTFELSDVSAVAHADLLTSPDGGGSSADALKRDLQRQLQNGLARSGSDAFRAGANYTTFDAVPHTFGLVLTALLYAKATGDHQYDGFASQQRSWALGANPWGTTFQIGAGEVFPHCPEHQVANLHGSLDGTGEILRGAVVNGPNGASQLAQLNTFSTMKPCAANPGEPWTDFDGNGARYLDDVGAWQTVEPAIDFTSTAALAYALTAS
jgi:hypothetical protein